MTAPLDGQAGIRRQLRGSSLLLGGRVLSMGLNFVTQVLIVRTLTKTEFGAFAYALAIAGFAEPLITLGLNRGASRFLSIYLEERDYGRLVGTLLLGIGTILSLGLSVAVVVIVLGERIGDQFASTEQAVALLAILILLAPIDALDGLVESGFAVFARPMSIFLRKHVVAPVLRLAVVALLVVADQGPRFLSAGYVVTGLLGVVFYSTYLVALLRRRGIFAELKAHPVRIPAREVLGFSVHLLSADLVYLIIATSSTIALGAFAGVAAVASYQAVLTPARLNYRIVTSSFSLLFMPDAARLHARGDNAGLGELYWQTAAWIAVLSFPVFALTSAFAGPLTSALYGQRYASAAPVMAWLAFGYFVNAALGFNAHTLQIAGHLGVVLRVNLACVAVNIGLTLALTPTFGAVGAAIATAATFLVQNLLNQLALSRRLGITLLARRALRIYLRIAVAIAALTALQLVLAPRVELAVLASAAAAIALVRTSRGDLGMADTFPELLKVPGMRVLLGAPAPTALGAAPPDQEG